jgi:2-hydroxy fatty acid dioxygenase
VNIAIHIVFVPLIYATSIILSGLIPPIPIASNLPQIRISDLGVAVYAIGYFLLEPIAGTLMLPFLLGCGYYARVLPVQFPREVIAKFATAANISSWIAQFIGHGFAEGRAPALFDNLFQVHSSFLGINQSRFI